MYTGCLKFWSMTIHVFRQKSLWAKLWVVRSFINNWLEINYFDWILSCEPLILKKYRSTFLIHSFIEDPKINKIKRTYLKCLLTSISWIMRSWLLNYIKKLLELPYIVVQHTTVRIFATAALNVYFFYKL